MMSENSSRMSVRVGVPGLTLSVDDGPGARHTGLQHGSRMSSTKKMKYSEDLWDGFAAISHRAEVGLSSLRNMVSIFRKRQQIDEQYSKAMLALYKTACQEKSSNMMRALFQTPIALITESGTIRAAWETVLDNSYALGIAHQDICRDVTDTVVSQLAAFVKDYEVQLKKMVTQGKNYVADYEGALKNVEKAKQAYDKQNFDAEVAALMLDLAHKDPTVKPKEYQRLNAKSLLSQEKAEQFRAEYEATLAVANETQALFHTKYMPMLLDEFQHWETIRIKICKAKIKQFVFAHEELPKTLVEESLRMEKGYQQIDPWSDVTDFILENKSYKQRPGPLEFEPYQSAIDPDDPQSSQKLLARVSKKSSARAEREKKSGWVEDTPPMVSEVAVFERKLEDVMMVQAETHASCPIPLIQQILTEKLIELGATETEGIFRVPAPSVKVEELREAIDNGKYDALNAVDDVSLFAAVLKLWFRKLVDPLVPSNLYFQSVSEPEKPMDVFKDLPRINQLVISYLVKFLRLLSRPEHVAITHMNESNLAMVFAPSFLRCPSDDPAVVLGNAAFEKEFVLSLMGQDGVLSEEFRTPSLPDVPGSAAPPAIASASVGAATPAPISKPASAAERAVKPPEPPAKPALAPALPPKPESQDTKIPV